MSGVTKQLCKGGKRCKLRRAAIGMRLDEFADGMGFEPSYVSDVELGLKRPSDNYIRALARVLGGTYEEWALDFAEDAAPAGSPQPTPGEALHDAVRYDASNVIPFPSSTDRP